MPDRLIAAATLWILGMLTAGAAMAAEPTYEFNLPRQSLAETLRAIGRQTTMNILFEPESVENLTAPAVRGLLSAEEAMKRALAGTKLAVEKTAANSILIAPAQPSMVKTSGIAHGLDLHLTQSENPEGMQKAESQSSGERHNSQNSENTNQELPSGGDSEDMKLDEVVVTGRKRTESMYDVPMSINVVSEDLIDKLGAQDFTDLMGTVPGLNAYQNGPGRTRLSIRGIANGEANDNETQNHETVSIYLDEIPISLGALNPELALFDLERVEVLRGPQGTLFGAGSMAGTIRLVSKSPDASKFEGKAEVSGATIAHGSETYGFKGAVNIPVIDDRLAVRATGYYTDKGGYIDNVLTGEQDINDGTIKGMRLSTRALISDRLIADFTVLLHDYSDNGRPEDIDSAPYLSRNYPSFDGFDDEIQVYNMTLQYDLGWGEIVSSSSYFDRNVVNRRSLDLLFELALPPGITPHELVDTSDLDFFAQEVRLASTTDSPLQWTVGAYVDKKDTFYLNTFPVPGADAVLGVPSSAFGAPDDHLFYGFDDLTVESWALFGEAYYKLDRLTFAAGLRHFDWQQDIEFYQSGFFAGGAIDDPRPQGKTDGINPKLNVSYNISDDMLIYTQIARGYRYGGVNGAIPEAVCGDEVDEVEREGGDVRFFEPDKLWNFEIGQKGTIAGDRLSFNASYFRIKWEEMQTNRAFFCGFGFRENVGEVTSKGIELELTAQVTEDLILGFAGSWIDSELAEDVPNLNAVKGDQAPFVAEFSFNASADYRYPISDSLEGFAWGNVVYVGDRHTQFSPDSANYRKMESYSVVNVRAGVLWRDMEFSIFANNLLDDDGVARALRRPPFDPDSVIRVEPRTVGVAIRTYF